MHVNGVRIAELPRHLAPQRPKEQGLAATSHALDDYGLRRAGVPPGEKLVQLGTRDPRGTHFGPGVIRKRL
jgi:hypothetical protein